MEQPWRKFERDIGLLVEAFGYEVEVTPPTNDFGADVVGIKRGRRVVIQCKLYTVGNVGHKDIVHLAGAMSYYKAERAMCITTSSYTKSAVDVAEKMSVHLVDWDQLLEKCREVSVTLPSFTSLSLPDISFPLEDEGLLKVGRDPTCDIFLEDMRVSRLHANLIREGGRLLVEDVGSTNGTRLNGQLIKGQTVLNYGDTIRFGEADEATILWL